MRANEFIYEVEKIELNKDKAVKNLSQGQESEQSLIAGKAKFLGKTATGHKIYQSRLVTDTSDAKFDAINPTTGLSNMEVRGYIKNGVFKNLTLVAHPGNTIKAHQLYHFLITKVGLTLMADRQSTGSMKVWGQLQRYHRDVAIHGWLNGKAVNIDMRDTEYTHEPKPRWNQNVSPEAKDAYNMKLVAYKK
jgi:hypothetical protein